MKKARQGVTQMGSPKPKRSPKGMSWMRPGNDVQEVRIRDMPVPSCPRNSSAAPPRTLHCSGCLPQEPGHRWYYDVETEHENNTVEHKPLTLTSLAEGEFEGNPARRRRSESGVDYGWRSDDTGIYCAASKSDRDE